MQFVKTIFIFLVCSGLIGASAYRDGRFDDARARRIELMHRMSERVDLLPMTIGDWTGAERPVSDVEAMRRGGAVRFVSRTYTMAETNESLIVLLFCGKSGPLSVHTPEVCIAGATFSADPDQHRWKPTQDSEFTWQTFSSKIDGQSNIEIAMAWTVDGRWKSPDSPRITFGGEPYLFKLYVIRPCIHESKPSAPLDALLAALVPSLQSTVFGDLNATGELRTPESGRSSSESSDPGVSDYHADKPIPDFKSTDTKAKSPSNDDGRRPK